MINTTPKCPYCDYVYDSEETWHSRYDANPVSTGDCEVSNLACLNEDCKRKFTVICNYNPVFSVVDEDSL